ncbi:MAG: hypothetical protein K0S61_2961 [Anaerocolumna sp.]|jgi:phi13 family phage major tail protein|nr:hypothetical protein [Anaerocolumna sp.]
MARKQGLKDLYICEVTVNDTTTYTAGTPIKVCRAVSGKVTPKSSSDPIYSDDEVEDIVSKTSSYDVEFEGDEISPESQALMFGHTFENGYLIKNMGDKPNLVAFGYRSKKTDSKYEFNWLYTGKFEPMENDYATEEDKAKTQTAKVKGTFYGRQKDGNSIVSVDESFLLAGDTAAQTAITNWFSQVQEKPIA